MTGQESGCALGEDAVCAPTIGPCLGASTSTGVCTRGICLGPVWSEAVLDQADQADQVSGLNQNSGS